MMPPRKRSGKKRGQPSAKRSQRKRQIFHVLKKVYPNWIDLRKLAEKCGISVTNAEHRVESYEHQGYVEVEKFKNPDYTSKPIKHVRITKAGINHLRYI